MSDFLTINNTGFGQIQTLPDGTLSINPALWQFNPGAIFPALSYEVDANGSPIYTGYVYFNYTNHAVQATGGPLREVIAGLAVANIPPASYTYLPFVGGAFDGAEQVLSSDTWNASNDLLAGYRWSDLQIKFNGIQFLHKVYSVLFNGGRDSFTQNAFRKWDLGSASVLLAAETLGGIAK
jgi:hypothetical protein